MGTLAPKSAFAPIAHIRHIAPPTTNIQYGRHQYFAIHHISLTSHYTIINNGYIPSFFCMAKSLMLLVLCFKVKVMHWVKAISHFNPAVVGPY